MNWSNIDNRYHSHSHDILYNSRKLYLTQNNIQQSSVNNSEIPSEKFYVKLRNLFRKCILLIARYNRGNVKIAVCEKILVHNNIRL